jgi:EmrB/QacA subfamily drug resistance transporter
VEPEALVDDPDSRSTASPATGTTAVEPDPKRWLALGVIAIAQLMVILDASIVNIALPQAQADLGISDVNRQWVVTAYMLAFGGLLLLGGRIADYVGRKRMFLVGLAGFAVASGLGGIAQNSSLLFSARALQGAFAALLAPAALSLITVTFTSTKERAQAFGVYGAVSGGGAAIGLLAGGALTEYASWRWCLLVNIPIAAVAALLAIPYVRESKAHGNTKYDLPGAVLVTGGLVSLVYGFTEAAKEDVGWSAGSTLGFIALAVVLLAAFVVVEARSSNPLLPLRVVLDRNRGGAYLAATLVGAGLFSMFLFLTYYFQVNLGYTPLKSGFAFLPFSLGIIVTAGVVSNILPRTGPKPLMVLGSVMAVIGLLMMTLISQDSSYVAVVLPGMLLLSIGMGLLFVPLSDLALVGVEEHDAGVASAMLNTSQQIGGSLGTALLSTFYASTVSGYLADNVKAPADVPRLTPLAFIEGYHVAFYIGAALLALASLTIIVLINAKREDLVVDGATAPAL